MILDIILPSLPVSLTAWQVFIGFMIVLIYAILGAGIKYVDDAFDEEIFDKRKAIIAAPLLGLLWVFGMTFNPVSAAMLGAVFLAVAIKLKIDSLGHMLGALMIAVPAIVLFYFGFISFAFIPLVVLTIAGLFDEILRDFLRGNYVKSHLLYRFLRGRYLVDIACFALALFGFIHWYWFLAFYIFGLAYNGLTRYGMNIKKSPLMKTTPIGWLFAFVF